MMLSQTVIIVQPIAATTLQPARQALIASAILARRVQMAGCAQSVSQEHTQQPEGMPVARAARRIQTLLQVASQSQPALAMLAQQGLSKGGDLVRSVWRASTRLRQEMPRAATAYQVNIQQRLVQHRMCVKDARPTPTSVTRNGL